MGAFFNNGEQYGGTATTASQVMYNTTESVADKIDEIDAKTGSDIPVSSSDTETSIAEAIGELEEALDSIPSSIYGGYRSYSVAIAENTTTTIATVTLPHGTWLVLGTADLSSNVPSVYNFVLGDRVVRATGESGGGAANYIVFRSYEGHESFPIYGYVKAATTFRTTINWIRLDGLKGG